MHSILAERNFEDRVVAIQRIIDLMLIFDHQRNLQGRQESKAVLLSAAVFRLKKAFEVFTSLDLCIIRLVKIGAVDRVC